MDNQNIAATIWWRCEMCDEFDAESLDGDVPVVDLLAALDAAHEYVNPECQKDHGHRYMRVSLHAHNGSYSTEETS